MSWKTQRIREFRELLRRDLAARESLSPIDRIEWLAAKLVEYLDRWIGLAEINAAQIAQLKDNVFCDLVAMTAETLTEEIQRHAPAADIGGWRQFTEPLASRDWHSLAEVKALQNALVKWVRVLGGQTGTAD